MIKPTEFEKKLSHAIKGRIGGSNSVYRYADDDNVVSLYVVHGADTPITGVSSYATIGLYRIPTWTGNDPVQCELVCACASETPNVDNLLSSCVVDALKNNNKITYGSYIEGIIDQYDISDTLHHVTFVSPFLWDGMNKLDVDGNVVYFLMMLPISHSELAYLRANGIDEFERILEEKQVDIFNMNRASAV